MRHGFLVVRRHVDDGDIGQLPFMMVVTRLVRAIEPADYAAFLTVNDGDIGEDAACAVGALRLHQIVLCREPGGQCNLHGCSAGDADRFGYQPEHLHHQLPSDDHFVSLQVLHLLRTQIRW